MMTNYSDNPAHVRCDRFKPSGKWYDTFVIDMGPGYLEKNLHCAIAQAILAREWSTASFEEPGWYFVVLEPYHHMGGFPVMIHGEHLAVHAANSWGSYE
jgi:hypothetical protein